MLSTLLDIVRRHSTWYSALAPMNCRIGDHITLTELINSKHHTERVELVRSWAEISMEDAMSQRNPPGNQLLEWKLYWWLAKHDFNTFFQVEWMTQKRTSNAIYQDSMGIVLNLHELSAVLLNSLIKSRDSIQQCNIQLFSSPLQRTPHKATLIIKYPLFDRWVPEHRRKIPWSALISSSIGNQPTRTVLLRSS